MKIEVGALLRDERREGRWRVAERLAEGRSFELWLVDDQHVEGVRAVAKRIRADGEHAAPRRALFEAERDLYLLPSTLLPEPLDWLVAEDGEPILVYELQSGETLEALVARVGPLGEARAARLVRELALFAAELHGAGFVLRDLSPAHVIIGLDDTLQVVGLGNATRASMPPAEDRSKTSHTPPFTAPELDEAGIVAPSADAYALGSLSAWLATGSVDGVLSPAFAEVVRACRARAPSSRPNARAIHESMARIVKSLARPSTLEPARPPPSPSRAPSVAPMQRPPVAPSPSSPPAREGAAAPKPEARAPSPNDHKRRDAAPAQKAKESPTKNEAPRSPKTWLWIAAGVLAIGAAAAYLWLQAQGKL